MRPLLVSTGILKYSGRDAANNFNHKFLSFEDGSLRKTFSINEIAQKIKWPRSSNMTKSQLEPTMEDGFGREAKIYFF